MLPILLIAQVSERASEDWLSRNSTLIVGIVGIVFSGFIGPTVTAWWAGRREQRKDERALAVARQDDLRVILDEAATILSNAVGQLRPVLAAAQEGEGLPREQADFLGSLVPLGQRLRLRLEENNPVVKEYDATISKLRVVSESTASQEAFDNAATAFEQARAKFLEQGRSKLREIISMTKHKGGDR